MTITEHLLHAKNVSLGVDLPSSRVARKVAQLGVLSYWLGLTVAAVALLVAGGFAALTAEPIWRRLLTVIFLGIFPSLVAYATGWILYCMLTFASAICDLTTALSQVIYLIVSENTIKVWMFSVWFAKDVIPRYVTAIHAFFYACHRSLKRVIATAAFSYARTKRSVIVAYAHGLFAVTFPIRLVARVLITIIPQKA